MIKIIRFIIPLFIYLPLHSQVITVNDFVNLAALTDKKFSSYVNKMGFVQISQNFDNGAAVNEFFYRNKKDPMDSTLRFIAGSKKGKATGVYYQTSSYGESDAIIRDFLINGFISSKKNTDSTMGEDGAIADTVKTSLVNTFKTDTVKVAPLKTDSNFFFQKEDMTIYISEEVRDEVRMFCFRMERKPVPTGSSVRFADDLMLFDSHEKLVAMFGNKNVRRDMYHFSETDSSRCSVLFPNTNRQGIFIWEDQSNYRMLSFLMIGGGLRAEGSADFNQSVSLNTWKSYSGLYTGMRMSEMLKLCESDFNFFGLRSEFAMMIVPEKKGHIDFSKTGITLGCFNCNGHPLLKKEKISAEAALKEGLQLYILSIVLLP